MSDFDLDVRTAGFAAPAAPQITSYSLCTPGCVNGGLTTFSRACNPSGGCSFQVSK